MNRFWNKVRFGLLLLLIALIVVSYHPVITNISRSAGMQNGTVLSRYIIMVFAVLFVFSIKSVFKFRIQRRLWLLFLFVLLSFLCVYWEFKTSMMLGDIRAMGICLCAIAIGCQLELKGSVYSLVLLLFAGLNTVIGLMQVLSGVGGFEITDIYGEFNKNSMGAELATAVLIYVFFFLDKSKNKLLRIIALSLSVFTVVILLTIRARAATLAALLMVVYLVYNTYKNNYKQQFILRLIGALMLVVFVVLILPNEAKDYVYNSFFQNHEDDITSGRTERNVAAIQFLRNNLLIGNLEGFSKIPWIHNYPLLKLYDYGLFFSFPILLVYLYLLFHAVKKTLKNQVTENGLGYFALLIPFIISMAEPTFPFGPGTATVINFIMFGFALREDALMNTVQ